MKTKDSKPKGKRSFADRLRAAFMAKDAESAEELAKEAEAMDEESEEERKKREAEEKEGKTGDALTQILSKLKAMDADIQELKKAKETDDGDDDEDDDGKKKTGDEGDLTEVETAGKLNQSEVDLYTGDAAASIPSRAEILAPGIKLPTLDAKMATADRAMALCKCQRKALDLAFKTDAGRAAIAPFLGGLTADFEKLPAALVHAAFMGASEMVKVQNNGAASKTGITTKDFGKVRTVAEINEANRKFWDRQGSAN